MKNTSYQTVQLTLAQAWSAIAAEISPTETEQVAVGKALWRVTATPLHTSRPKPSYSQSTRDGFALSSTPQATNSGQAVFHLSGEIAAGSLEVKKLKPGHAVRIMTGAMVPDNCERVIPFEVCREHPGTVAIPLSELNSEYHYIRHRGSDIREGALIVETGTRLRPAHLLTLAENGSTTLPVSRKPAVAILCSGSELVEVGTVVRPGQKISGNSILLAALLQSYGAACSRSVTVDDEPELITTELRRMLAAKPDMIITTGGMGPGRFDLMEQVFARLGGRVVYSQLKVRPGKATLLGIIEQIPFFALPGPPPAVRLLFHELIVPALSSIKGCAANPNQLIDAVLETTVPLKESSYLNLTGAVLRIEKGNLLVRPAKRHEAIDAIIHLSAQKSPLEAGDMVKIRLTQSGTS